MTRAWCSFSSQNQSQDQPRGQALSGKLPIGYARASLSSSGLCPRKGQLLSLCFSPPPPPFLTPCLDNFLTCSFTSSLWGVAASTACPRESWVLGSLAAQVGRSHGRQWSNSGCLGRGRPVYPGQGPGRGCSFLPTPLALPATQHTDSAVPICTCSFHKYWWGAYCAPSTVLHAEDIASNMADSSISRAVEDNNIDSDGWKWAVLDLGGQSRLLWVGKHSS